MGQCLINSNTSDSVENNPKLRRCLQRLHLLVFHISKDIKLFPIKQRLANPELFLVVFYISIVFQGSF